MSDYTDQIAAFPDGAQVRTTAPIDYIKGHDNLTGQTHHAPVPVGTIGKIIYHTTDGRANVDLGYPYGCHTFSMSADHVPLAVVDAREAYYQADTYNAMVAVCRAVIEYANGCRPFVPPTSLRALAEMAKDALEMVDGEAA